MTPSQNRVKVFARVLAIIVIVLIFAVISLFMFISIGGISLTNFLFGTSSDEVFTESYENVEELQVEVNYCTLNILPGDSFKVEASSVDLVKAIYVDNTLVVEEMSNLVEAIGNSTLTIYIPENTVLDEFKLDTNFSDVNVENLRCDKLDLDIGAGNAAFLNLRADESAEIESGTGELTMSGCQLNNLVFENGIGKVNISGKITGKSEFDCGIGDINILLDGALTDYTIKGRAGAGSFMLGTDELNGKFSFDGGQDTVSFSGKTGDVTVNFTAAAQEATESSEETTVA